MTTNCTKEGKIMTTENITTFIFDYGATIDTPGIHWEEVIWTAYEKANVDVTRQQFHEAYVATERFLGNNPVILPTDTFYITLDKKLHLQAELGNLPTKEKINDMRDFLYETTKRNIADSRKTLESLKQKGMKLGLVSNFYGNIQTVLKEFALDEYFQVVVESAKENIRKPDPRLLALAIERIGSLPSETVVVGDHFEKDIMPALQLGCRTIWIRNGIAKISQ